MKKNHINGGQFVVAPFSYTFTQDDETISGISYELYFIDENDKLVLVDYKTDYVEEGKEKELVEKYKTQLELYRSALEQAMDRKVDKMGIYSLYLQKIIFI